MVDPVQYRARVDDFDFDITVAALQLLDDAGRLAAHRIFSSQAAATKGSHNLAGIADPAIDALIETIIAAKTRAELTTACRALDRVIRAGRYWVPHWYTGVAPDRLLGRVRPSREEAALCRGIPETWWYDPAKASEALWWHDARARPRKLEQAEIDR